MSVKETGCDSEEEVDDLYVMILQAAKGILDPEVMTVPVVEMELEASDWDNMNLVAVTDIQDFYKRWYTIYIDPAFYSLKTEYQISTLIHELAHVQCASHLLTQLETGQITADQFNDQLNDVIEAKGHNQTWKDIARAIAKKFGTDPDLPCIKYIDFEDDQFWM